MNELKKHVQYEDFGAAGDGVTNDFAAIRQAHDYANKNGLSVISDPTKTYYIGNDAATALVMTDTNWSTTRFIIDDTDVTIENRQHHIFKVCSGQPAVNLDAQSIRKEQMKIVINSNENLSGNAFVVAVNENNRQFMRVGPNQNINGEAQTDCFILDQTGVILTPVIWNFDGLTSLVAYPIDERILTVTGGIFTTIANQVESNYTYYGRGLLITRSNVVIDGLVHGVTGELDHGAPYHGFARTEDCAYVTFKNCHFTGHKIYETIGSANMPVLMGTYDISLFRSIGVSFINCKQDNIMDTSLWGVFTSNYCKDILVDGCTFSRIDAHMDVTNYTIKNSIIGWMGIKAIGHGHLLVENVTIFSGEIIQLRMDYGSNWDGDLIIRNVIWYPVWAFNWKSPGKPAVITGGSTGGHNFGYPCGQPHKVTIENLRIMDGELAATDENYSGASIFSVNSMINEQLKSFGEPAEGDSPYVFTSELILRGLSTQSGKGYSIWSEYPVKGYCSKPHVIRDGTIVSNFSALIDGIDRFELTAPDILNLDTDYDNNHRLVPKITIKNCENLSVNQDQGAYPMIVTTDA